MEKRKTKEVCIGLEFGTPLNVQFEGIGSAKTSLVGIDRDRCVIIKPPPLAGLESRLFKKNQTVVSYLHEGMVYGFRCTLLGLIRTPFPLLVLSYPEASETLNLRRHKRMPCLFPGRIRSEDRQMTVVMTDVSPSGCRLSLTDLLSEQDLPRPGSMIEMTVAMEPIQENLVLAGSVKNVQGREGEQHLGIEFLKATLQPDLEALEKVRQCIAAVRDRVLF